MSRMTRIRTGKSGVCRFGSVLLSLNIPFYWVHSRNCKTPTTAQRREGKAKVRKVILGESLRAFASSRLRKVSLVAATPRQDIRGQTVWSEAVPSDSIRAIREIRELRSMHAATRRRSDFARKDQNSPQTFGDLNPAGASSALGATAARA